MALALRATAPIATSPTGSDGSKTTAMIAPPTHASSKRISNPAKARPFSASGARLWVRLSNAWRPTVAVNATMAARPAAPTRSGVGVTTKQTRPAAARQPSRIFCSSRWRRMGPAAMVAAKPAMPPTSRVEAEDPGRFRAGLQDQRHEERGEAHGGAQHAHGRRRVRQPGLVQLGVVQAGLDPPGAGPLRQPPGDRQRQGLGDGGTEHDHRRRAEAQERGPGDAAEDPAHRAHAGQLGVGRHQPFVVVDETGHERALGDRIRPPEDEDGEGLGEEQQGIEGARHGDARGTSPGRRHQDDEPVPASDAVDHRRHERTEHGEGGQRQQQVQQDPRAGGAGRHAEEE